MTHAAPSLRADVALLTGGRRGTDEDTLALAAAILLDAALLGVVDVTGRRVLGVDRRRVVPGPRAPDPAAEPLLADLRRRVEAATPETPMGWCERIAVFGEDAVAAEVVEDGLARPIDVPWLKRLLRHRTLDPDPAAVAAARERLEAGDVALALLLRETELLTEIAGRRGARRIDRLVREDALPEGARAIVATLRERRRRGERIGSYYADD